MINFYRALKAVFSAFIGIRRRNVADLPEIRPYHYIIAGLTVLLLLVLSLLAAVRAVV